MKTFQPILLLCLASRLLAADGGTLTLREALALATSRSPELAAFSYDQRVADARLLQAGLKPNPVVLLEGEDFLGGGDYSGLQQSQTTLSLGQLLELGGKRAARQQVARAGQAAVQYDYEAKRREVLRKTTEAFVEALGAQRRVALAEETAKLAVEFVPLIQKRATAGAASSIEQARGDVTLATSRIAVEQARHDLSAARRTLAAQWAAKELGFATVAGDLDRRPAKMSFTTAYTRLEQHPLVIRWDAEREVRSAIVAREKASAKPDVTVSGGARWLQNGGSGEPAVVAGVSIPLPFSNRNQGNIAEAQALVEKVDEEKRAALAALGSQLGEAWESLAKSHKQIDLLERLVLPATDKAIDAATKGYQAGRLSQLEVLDTRRTLTDARIQALEARIAAHKAAAILDALTAPSPDFSNKTIKEPTKTRK